MEGHLSVSLAYAAVLHDDGINAGDIVMVITSQYLLETHSHRLCPNLVPLGFQQHSNSLRSSFLDFPGRFWLVDVVASRRSVNCNT